MLDVADDAHDSRLARRFAIFDRQHLAHGIGNRPEADGKRAADEHDGLRAAVVVLVERPAGQERHAKGTEGRTG